LRELTLNGYIDEEVWFGDEITPENLHEAMYGAENQFADDVHIRLNSYGGSCNAATRMFDDVRAYPGDVHITISGTAASAATVLAMAADRLEMTPGSLLMVHDPSVIALGNERDLAEAICLLRACKESILNVYATRCKMERGELAAMMTATAWMDAKAALGNGFIDGIVEDAAGSGPQNTAKPRAVDRAEAEAKVKAWLDRRKQQPSRPTQGDEHTSSVTPAGEQEKGPEGRGGTAQALPVGTGSSPPESVQAVQTPETSSPTEQPEEPGTPVAQLQKRLGLIMPTRR
jgi:ATP-dependent protease ClpP protease subunit